MNSSTSNSKGPARLLLNIGLLAVIVVAINQLLLLFLPYPWAEEQFNGRFAHYLANHQIYDTLFVGSSRTYRQADPAVFDQGMAGSTPTRSFNLGAPANAFPKTARSLEEILAHNPQALQTILFELTPFSIGSVPPENRHTLQQVYWVDWYTWRLQMRAIWNSDRDWLEKLDDSGMQTAFLLEKQLNAGLGADILAYFLTERFRDARYLGRRGDGFYPLEEAVVTDKPENRQVLAQRRAALLADPSSLQNLVDGTRAIFRDAAALGEPYDLHLETLMAARTQAAEQGIDLIFVLPPRMTGPAYRSVLPLFYALPPEARINLADPGQYPAFYDLENSFDLLHLNTAGSQAFTRALADAVQALKTEQPD